MPNALALVAVLAFLVPVFVLLLLALIDNLTDDSYERYLRIYEEQRNWYQKYMEKKQEERLNRIETKLDELLKKEDDPKEKKG